MSKPYFLCAYGHVMRISERCDTATQAAKYCYGIVAVDRMTIMKVEGTGWAYRSGKDKQELVLKLARRHKEKTGSVLSGYEKQTTDVQGPVDPDAPAAPAEHMGRNPLTEEVIDRIQPKVQCPYCRAEMTHDQVRCEFCGTFSPNATEEQKTEARHQSALDNLRARLAHEVRSFGAATVTGILAEVIAEVKS